MEGGFLVFDFVVEINVYVDDVLGFWYMLWLGVLDDFNCIVVLLLWLMFGNMFMGKSVIV